MRRGLTVFLVAAATWLLARPASASLFLVLDRTSGPPGSVVHARTGGSGAFGANSRGSFPLFFVPTGSAEGVTSPGDPSLVRVGSLSVDAHGDGRATFLVPKVAPGPYLVMIDCPSCAAYSAGRTMLVVGPFPTPFDVLPSRSADTSGTLFWPWVAAGAVAAVVAMWLVRKHESERVGRGR